MQKLQCQYNLMMLGLLGFAILYILRVNLSVAIIAMVGTSKELKDGISLEESCPVDEKSIIKNNVIIKGEINWDENACGKALASFFYGYLLTNFAGGRLADRFGGKKVYGYGVLLTSLLAFLLPAAARYSKESFYMIRLLQGMTEGVSFPSMNTLMSSWVQPSQRSYFISRCAAGCQLGTVIALSIGGWLAQTSFGWPSVFYLSGSLGLVWCVAWYHMVTDHPNSHPLASEEEKLLILKEIGSDKKSRDEVETIPWRYIFSSVPFLAIIMAHCGANFGFYFLLTELPTYLSTVHHFDIKNNGLISSFPYFFMLVSSICYGSLVHSLTTREVVTIRTARKISTILGTFVPMILLLSISYAGCNSWLAVAIICTAVASTGADKCGFLCGFQDLSPNYAGTLTGISNTLASFPGFLAPLITSALIEGKPTIGQWNKVFMLSSFIYFIGGIFYLCFMSSDVQPWNNYTRKKISSGTVKTV